MERSKQRDTSTPSKGCQRKFDAEVDRFESFGLKRFRKLLFSPATVNFVPIPKLLF
ncbi:MAG: hypothetical protein M0Z80_00395 [Treponema sp.]|nr:hypothetical protein [Treponema sp.]